MPFPNLQIIRYGWMALAGLVITGTTIYVADNQRHHVEPVDIIHVTLGTVERCFTTQTATGHWEIVTNTVATVTNLVVVTSNEYSLGVYHDRVYTVTNVMQYDQFLADEDLGCLYEETSPGSGSYQANVHGEVGRGPWYQYYLGQFYYLPGYGNVNRTNDYWYLKLVTTVTTNEVVTPGYTTISTNWTGETFAVTPPTISTTWTTNVYTKTLYVGVYYLIKYTNSQGITTNAVLTNTWINQVAVYTNTVKDTFGFHVDAPVLDATIKALVPYFIDPDSLVEGSSNIVSLTVTGLWDKLKIGNGGPIYTYDTNGNITATNWGSSFTREPCWTNPASTNYVICYTNNASALVYDHQTMTVRSNYNGFQYRDYVTYYTTNIVWVTNCYTSSLPQTGVNFIALMTPTQTVTSGITGGTNYYDWYNWIPIYTYTNLDFITPTIRPTTTNNAVYGDMGWQMYPEDLQERYKVLQALQISRDRSIYGPFYDESRDQRSKRCKTRGRQRWAWSGDGWGETPTNWVGAVASVATRWTNNYEENAWNYSLFYNFQYYPPKNMGWYREGCDYLIQAMNMYVTNAYSIKVFPDELYHSLEFWYRMPINKTMSGNFGYYSMAATTVDVYEANGFPEGGDTPGWHLLTSDPQGWTTNAYNTNGWTVAWGLPIATMPPQCDEPIKNVSQRTPLYYDGVTYSNYWGEARGGPLLDCEAEIYRWQFNYCTEKYWE